jgi:flagellar biogenesis protein FliO
MEAGDWRLPLPLPAYNTFSFRLSLPKLCIGLLAVLAFCGLCCYTINKLHTTSFSHAIFLIAVLAEVAPLEISASEPVLLVKTHRKGELKLSVTKQAWADKSSRR